MRLLDLQHWGLDKRRYGQREQTISIIARVGFILMGLLMLCFGQLVDLYSYVHNLSWRIPDSPSIEEILSIVYLVLGVAVCIWRYTSIRQHGNLQFVSAIQGFYLGALVSIISLITIGVTTLSVYSNRAGISFSYLLNAYFEQYTFVFVTLGAIVFVTLGVGALLNKKGVDIHKAVDQTSKNFGSAEFATTEYLKEQGFYSEVGALLGKDEKNKFIRHNLVNRTIISSTGGGKSAAIIIPALLTENRPIIVHDVKGELWAVTAKYRAEVLKRNVVAIDPFGVLKDKGFIQDKPENICQEFTINPLDYVPEDERFRDRALTALGKSLVVPETQAGHSSHWEENAKLLLGGLIEYILKYSEDKTLVALHDIVSEDAETMEELLKLMHSLEDCPRARAAAGQVLKVGNDERGSIYSTTYRQVQWLVDSNLRHTFSHSNFDLRNFLKGNMDIYVVIPTDQVKSQSRVIRMIFSTISAMLVQTSPSQLPRRKILSIFDELGQLGYNDDVEWSIEVMRAYGVVNWCVFQDIDQIELYQKPNLFKNAKEKQFFEIDDPKTMEWIQKLGGKRTILTESISENSGVSTNSSSMLNKNNSQGEGRSVHETSSDLIHLNEIRELSKDEQFVFVRGYRAIKCKKVYYYKEPFFFGMYENNPLEFERT